jgi:hypothetical protein
MIGRKDKRHSTKLQIQNCPTKGNPEGKEEDHWLGEKKIFQPGCSYQLGLIQVVA